MKITTNNQYRDILNAYDLTSRELEAFDYLEEGEGSFIRYKGRIWDLGEFMRTDLKGWDGISSDTYFSGSVIKLSEDGDTVKVGYVYS
tara:strand:- start:294 stop:557 length:264 start_codon:yes stop_codon:yes gene_type:complete